MNELPQTIISDDHPIFIEGLKSVLCQHITLVGCAGNGLECLELLKSNSPQLLILDLNLPEKNGFEILDWIQHHKADGPKVLVLTMYKQPHFVTKAMEKGASGYLLKDEHILHIKEAISMILKGNTYIGPNLPKNNGICRGHSKTNGQFKDEFLPKQKLTKRELQVLELITEAFNNKEIGQKLFISDQTVGVHRKNIMRKLGVTNTAGLIKLAFEHHLV